MAEQQHRVSRVYLKGFACDVAKEKVWTADKWMALFLHGVGHPWAVEEKPIADLTVTDGEFELGSVDPEDKDKLEKFFGKFERMCPRVLKAVDARKLNNENRDFLIGFVASLLVRSRHFRLWMDSELRSPDSQLFLRTMCMYMPPEEQPKRIANIEQFPAEHRLNHACYAIWHHLYHRLGNFKMVFFENSARGWETCDDPVVLRNIEARGGSLLGRASEIYVPLDRKWCLFMYDSKSNHPLNPMRLSPDTFAEADKWVQFAVREFVHQNADQQLFFSEQGQFAES